MPRPSLRPLLLCSLALAALPHLAAAERVAPLAPPKQFDSLAVPLPPLQPTPPVRVPSPQPPVVPPPGWNHPAPPPPEPPQLRIQSQVAPPPEAGVDMMERGAGVILQNLLNEMQPTFEQMARGLDGAAQKFGPALDQLGTLVDDIRNYQAPERLPNGDILIRRRADAPPPPPSDALGDLATPQDTPKAPPAPPAPSDPPPLAAPIPVVPPGTQIDL